MRRCVLLTSAAVAMAGAALAGEVEIVAVEAVRAGEAWRFDVTLAHGDEGWDHYADAWEVRLEDGTVLGTRELLHPHVTEQPFTRSHRVTVPAGVSTVYVFARDSVHGWTADGVAYALPN